MSPYLSQLYQNSCIHLLRLEISLGCEENSFHTRTNLISILIHKDVPSFKLNNERWTVLIIFHLDREVVLFIFHRLDHIFLLKLCHYCFLSLEKITGEKPSKINKLNALAFWTLMRILCLSIIAPKEEMSLTISPSRQKYLSQPFGNISFKLLDSKRYVAIVSLIFNYICNKFTSQSGWSFCDFYYFFWLFFYLILKLNCLL